MSNTLVRWGYAGSPEHMKLVTNKAEAAALLRQIDSIPSSRLTVGDLRFVMETPDRSNVWSTKGDYIRFYTDARIARLREIARRSLG